MNFSVCLNGITIVSSSSSGSTRIGKCPASQALVSGAELLTSHLEAEGTSYTPLGVPSVSEWGLIVMTLLGLTLGTVVIGRRKLWLAGAPAGPAAVAE